MTKIIIVVDTYYPDKTSGSKLIGDLIEELIKKHKVLLICPRDKLLKNNKKKNLILQNIYCGPIKSNNFIIRGVFEIIMPFIIWIKVKKSVKKFNPNLLVCYSPSIFFNYLCKKINLYTKCKTYLILRDIFPFWVFDVGKINNFFLKKILIDYFINFCNRFEKIGVEAKSNIHFLRKNGIKNKIEHLPNWINYKDFQYKKKLVKEYYNFAFLGNIGRGQDIKKINKFINTIKNKNFIRFSIYGDGAKKYLLKINQNSRNLNLEKPVAYKNLLNKMKTINFGIVSLKEEIKTVNFPGKILTYLLTNTPILILSKKKNELTNFIEQKKIGVRMGNKKNFENVLKNLIKIEKKASKDKHYFKKILKKYFSVIEVKNKILNF